jgi:hypothetical protein
LREEIRKVGEAADLLLRPDGLAVRDHVELALLPGDHLGVVPEAVQLRHETRGALVVPVSDGAVVDRNAGHPATVALGKPVAAGAGIPGMRAILHTRILLVTLAALPLILTACGKGGGGY